ncbi:hypothetical protein AU210_016579 [Fusarium oxysporum f. sp. radicis-cucumerinum]|uniref:Uncharacterized protein n=1 Tax=Fusarium oxysporum f. sp. radicis-cucumerinum TaxID=327505 RepID=A0A2H3G618_FUSOX|nr:hypothetical protein AU210_016579 [Fusarium oxysporum f. sp. radicis-cucumerinum]
MEPLLLCILWVLCAKRPLRPEEFYHALWSGLSLKGLADSELPDITISDAGGSANRCVISSSKGLAEITKAEKPTVQFIHESVRDFLLKSGGLHELWPDLGFDWEIPSHERLKQCCYAYMHYHLVHTPVSKLLSEAKPNLQREGSKDYPFLEYASQHVLYHADVAADAIPQDEFLSRFPIPNWISIINLFERYQARRYSPKANLLYILAEKDFSNLIRTRLHGDPRTDILGERYRYPLFTALAHGNKGSVAALLNSPSTICDGVDIAEGLNCRKDLKEYQNRTPLSWAAQDGRAGIVKLLLQTGTAINDVDGEGRTSLSRASWNGHEAVARILIDKGADINTSDNFGSTPLLGALWNGHEAVARLLIEKGADVNVSDKDGWTPLLRALRNGHEAVARLLIDKGADSV